MYKTGYVNPRALGLRQLYAASPSDRPIDRSIQL